MKCSGLTRSRFKIARSRLIKMATRKTATKMKYPTLYKIDCVVASLTLPVMVPATMSRVVEVKMRTVQTRWIFRRSVALGKFSLVLAGQSCHLTCV